MTEEMFQRLGFLLQFDDIERGGISLIQASPFFVNSDPDMPAIPVSTSQILDWILEKISTALEQISDKQYPKENGVLNINVSDSDVTMTDACTNKGQSSSRSQAFVEGVSKASVVRQASDIMGSSVKVQIMN